MSVQRGARRGWALRYVAICDVLGFRNIAEERGMEWILSTYDDLTQRLKEAFRWEARAVTFSDTVLLFGEPILPITARVHRDWQRHRSEAFFRYVCLLMQEGITLGLPLRCGIARGMCSIMIRRGVFLGQPIIDAYEVEQSQDWLGVALHSSCFSWLDGLDPAAAFSSVVPYDVPTKINSSPLKWTLAWAHQLGSGVPPDVLQTLDDQLERNRGTQHEARWTRTASYVRFLQSASAQRGLARLVVSTRTKESPGRGPSDR